MLNKRLDIAIHISSAFWTVQKRDVHLKPRFEKLNSTYQLLMFGFWGIGCRLFGSNLGFNRDFFS